MKRHDGKDNFNNAIEIDYERKRVDFRPVKGEMKEWTPYLTTVAGVQRLLSKLLLLFFTVQVVTWAISRQENLSEGVLLMGSYLVLIYLISPYLMLLAFTSKKMRENYPIINAKVMELCAIFTGKGDRIVKGKVNLETIRNREFILDRFANIFFNYKAKGEVAKCIRKVKIRNLYSDNTHYWEIVFVFSKIPKKGELYVEYL